MDLNRAGNHWLVWSSVTGAAVGGVGGFIYATQTKVDATDITGEIRLFHIVIGALGGAAVGAIVGGVQRWRLHGQAEGRSRQASQAFDGSLRQRLDLSVEPTQGGALGQLSLAF
jgi:hypothetical protein